MGKVDNSTNQIIQMGKLFTKDHKGQEMQEGSTGVGYYPFGVQTNVPLSKVLNGNWTVCFKNTYDKPMPGAFVDNIAKQACTKQNIMIGCRKTDTPDTLTVLAWSPHDFVFKKGRKAEDKDINNGAKWFRSIDLLGFTSAGTKITGDWCSG